MGVNSFTPGTDKIMKHILNKDAQKREVGINLKIGALRLGEEFLYISVSFIPNQTLIIYYAK